MIQFGILSRDFRALFEPRKQGNHPHAHRHRQNPTDLKDRPDQSYFETVLSRGIRIP
jgi:hypothetical protein